MGANKRRLRMLGDDVVELFEELLARLKLRTIEKPLRVGVQLMPALVEPIQGSKKRGRVAGVNHYRPTVFGAQLPNRLQLRIIYRHRSAVFVLIPQPERLVKLEPLGAGLKTLFQLLGFTLAPTLVVDALEIA